MSNSVVIFLILLILLEGTNVSLAADSRAYGKSSLRTTAAGTESYTWDYENRLTALTKPGVGSYSYKYDHRARRVTRDESLAGGLKTFLSFSGGSSVQERSTAGVLITELIRGSDWGGGVGGILYSIRSGLRNYNTYNSRGDVVSTSADNGSATWQASYQALGKRTAENGTNAERERANTKEEDPTGLLNEGHRYRDLDSGEFISRDPMGFIDGPNVYAYVRQNPWSGFDPEGLYEKDGSVTNNLLEASKAIQMNPSRSFGDSMKAMGLGIVGAVAIVPEAVSFSFRGAEIGLAEAKTQVMKDVASGQTNRVVGGIANIGIEVFGEGSLELTGMALFRPVHEAIVNPSGGNVLNAAASLIIVKGAGPEGQSARGASVSASAEAKVGDKVTRHWGGKSGPDGASWTRDPASAQTRERLGLGRSNTGEFISEGTLIDTTGVTVQKATPWDGFKGGGDEVLVPDVKNQIRLDSVRMPDKPLPNK